MKRIFLILPCILLAFSLDAATFAGGRLEDRTLRLDYIFSGTDKTCDIALAHLKSLDGWAGRRVNLDSLPLRGNGQITMTDKASGDTLYRTSFSTLFQEWQATQEATRVRRSFENVFLVPMPVESVEVCVQLFDFHDNVVASMSHSVDPRDILIKPAGGWVSGKGAAAGEDGDGWRVLHHGGSPEEKIDVVILAEGYSSSEMELFYKDAKAAVESLFAHEPFGSMRDCFNIVALGAPSADSGVSVPREGVWKNTVAGSHFDTFYSDRYLTTPELFRMHDILSGVPYEHIIILANTDTYGGGGIYNSYTLTTAHHSAFAPVVVHEFGHSFAGLADEYAYDDQFVEYYYPDTEPWERNITTRADFGSKWEDMLGKDGVGLVEGAGYQSKGVWRACEDCRMRTNSAPAFCPVCRRAIESLIRFYTGD